MQIDLRDLRLEYGGTVALDSVTLSIPSGGIHGLLGRNGSGKTSLMSILAGFRKHTSGEVLVDGEPVFENARIVRNIALIRESGDTVEGSDRVSEALRYAAYLRPNWDAEHAAALLDKFEVSTTSKLDSLSRGKKSAVGVMLGLAARTPLTMFDETYLGMDAPSRYVFYDEVLQGYIVDPTRTFLLSTHLIEEVSRIFNRVTIIAEGRVLLNEDIETLRIRGAAMTGPVDSVRELARTRNVIGERSLGGTMSLMVYDDLDDGVRTRARASGVTLEPLDLQDLFVYLTGSEKQSR